MTNPRGLTVYDVARPDLRGPATVGLDDRLARAAGVAGAHGALGTGERASVEAQLHEAFAAVMQRDLVGVLGAAWQVSTALHEAAERTVARPGLREVVGLDSQEARQTFRPSVSVSVNGVRLVTVTVSIEVILTLRAVALAVVSDQDGDELLHRGPVPLTSALQLPLARPIRLAQRRTGPRASGFSTCSA